MGTASEEILQQLLSLPVETRAALAEKLLESLDPPDERNNRLWAEEAERRVEAYERGEMEAIPGEEVFARLRAKFPKR
jgi:putative addiction module component (TIGR02574 family)